MADQFLGTWVQDEVFRDIPGFENFVKVEGLSEETIKQMLDMKLSFEYKKSDDGKYSCVMMDGRSGDVLISSPIDLENDQEITGFDQKKYQMKKTEIKGNTMIEDTTPIDQPSMKGNVTKRTIIGDKMESITTLKGTSLSIKIMYTKKK